MHFDAAIVPFQLNDLTESVHPIKALEYLARRRPVVATPLPDLQSFHEVVRFAQTDEQWSAQLAAATAIEARFGGASRGPPQGDRIAVVGRARLAHKPAHRGRFAPFQQRPPSRHRRGTRKSRDVPPDTGVSNFCCGPLPSRDFRVQGPRLRKTGKLANCWRGPHRISLVQKWYGRGR